MPMFSFGAGIVNIEPPQAFTNIRWANVPQLITGARYA